MKLTLVSLCLLIGPALAQDQPKPPQALTPTQGFPPVVSDQARAALLESLRDATMSTTTVKGNYILRDGSTVTAEGEVEVKTREVTIRADRAVIDTKTGEVQASGKVRIIPVNPPPKVKDVFPRMYEELQRLQEQSQRQQQ
jgi:lipopolysaccharide assembly outer membrane protein LptD (OstA)